MIFSFFDILLLSTNGNGNSSFKENKLCCHVVVVVVCVQHHDRVDFYANERCGMIALENGKYQ
jgi:hypothetical protein